MGKELYLKEVREGGLVDYQDTLALPYYHTVLYLNISIFKSTPRQYRVTLGTLLETLVFFFFFFFFLI